MARIVVTGSTDGLGLLAAKKLLAEGHQVAIHARNTKRADSALKQIPGAKDMLIGDLSSMDETRQLALKIKELGPFDAIIHNAGILHVPEDARSADGLPLLFAVNSLAPYILTAMIDCPERVIFLSSSMHRQGNASVERLRSIPGGKYFPGYSDTKLHDLILALSVARKRPDVYSNAVDPGWVPTKMGGRCASDDLEKGFETQVWLATSQDQEVKRSGQLLYHKKEVAINPQAKDERIQDEFLSVCEKISGIRF